MLANLETKFLSYLMFVQHDDNLVGGGGFDRHRPFTRWPRPCHAAVRQRRDLTEAGVLQSLEENRLLRCHQVASRVLAVRLGEQNSWHETRAHFRRPLVLLLPLLRNLHGLLRQHVGDLRPRGKRDQLDGFILSSFRRGWGRKFRSVVKLSTSTRFDFSLEALHRHRPTKKSFNVQLCVAADAYNNQFVL